MDQSRTQDNACRQPKKEVKTNKDCIQIPSKPPCTNLVSTCCSISPVSPAPEAEYQTCTKKKYCFKKMCKNVTNECGKAELTDYGKEYMSESMGSITQNCICVKHNGLQDSCTHPECLVKCGCLDDPFPTCPPGKKWRQDYNRNKQIPDDCFD